MSEHQLERVSTKGTSQQLVTKTDPKHRHVCFQQLADLRHFLIHRSRIARTIRQEDSIRFESQRFCGRSRGGHDCRAHSTLRQFPQRVSLYAEVVTNDVKSL